MLPAGEGDSINGPSLVRVPDWLPGRQGRYYLYFAHHHGQYIRLAFADDLAGPWRVLAGGVLNLAEIPAARGHVASPDVHVDAARREVRMYVHAPLRDGNGQRSFVALSPDGLRFTALPAPLGPFYFRCFCWRGAWWALAKGGVPLQSADGLTPFRPGPNPFPEMTSRRHAPGVHHNSPGDIRHLAVDLQDDDLVAYYSRIGDAPERILRRRIALTGDIAGWRAGPVEEVLSPLGADEGADLALTPSIAGAATSPENALRDPAILAEGARRWLVYAVAGESGLAIAEILRP
jgi:hypothetical protein